MSGTQGNLGDPPARPSLATTGLASSGQQCGWTAGASLNQRDLLLNSTPLGWAWRWGRIDLGQFYLSRAADPREPEAEPWATPLAWANKAGHREIADLLARMHPR